MTVRAQLRRSDVFEAAAEVTDCGSRRGNDDDVTYFAHGSSAAALDLENRVLGIAPEDAHHAFDDLPFGCQRPNRRNQRRHDVGITRAR